MLIKTLSDFTLDKRSLGNLDKYRLDGAQSNIDGIDQYTKLMLHMNGANGSTTFTDSSLVPKTVTANGNAQISTAQYKFGEASGLFDGTDDYLSLADSADWDFGSGDFTIDFWGYALNKGGASNGIIIGQALGLGGTTASWAINTSGSTIGFNASSGGGSWDITNVATTVSTSTNDWKHYMFVKSSGTLRIYVNGSEVINGACGTMPNSTHLLTIGRGTSTGNSISGYVDELRVSKIARSILIPTSEYTL